MTLAGSTPERKGGFQGGGDGFHRSWRCGTSPRKQIDGVTRTRGGARSTPWGCPGRLRSRPRPRRSPRRDRGAQTRSALRTRTGTGRNWRRRRASDQRGRHASVGNARHRPHEGRDPRARGAGTTQPDLSKFPSPNRVEGSDRGHRRRWRRHRLDGARRVSSGTRSRGTTHHPGGAGRPG